MTKEDGRMNDDKMMKEGSMSKEERIIRQPLHTNLKGLL